MNKEIVVSAAKVKRKKKIIRTIKITIFIILLLLLILYIVFGIIYNNGSFSVHLDRDLYLKNGIIIYEDPDYKVFRSELQADTLKYIDNISYKWLPNDLNKPVIGGSHNGENYVAYTFYIENLGEEIADYWSEINIDDVMKSVDDVIRIRVYKNDEEITYAKMSKNDIPEKDTTPFVSEDLVSREHITDFKPGDCDKYTLVIWIEGNDPECTDNILGGEIKIQMDFKSEIIK